jgi:hypothetical protein
LIWISADARFGQSRLEDSEVAELNRDVVGQTVSDLVERTLDNIEDLMLDHSGLIADRNYDVAFGKLCHTYKQESCAATQSRAWLTKKSKFFAPSRLAAQRALDQ